MAGSKRTSPECEMAASCLATRLRLLNRVVSGIYDDALRSHGIRVSQMNILVAIARMGSPRAVDVARWLQLDASTLSRDLERLIKRGWVRTSPGKGRATRLEATPAGRLLIQSALGDWRTAQKKTRDLLSPAAVDAILGAVDALRAASGKSV